MSILIAAWALALQSPPAPETGWTWTLYADTAPVVLANEIPDTPSLRSTARVMTPARFIPNNLKTPTAKPCNMPGRVHLPAQVNVCARIKARASTSFSELSNRC